MEAKQLLPQPGDTLVDRYQIVDMIGEGGMGVVYEAMHLRLGTEVAIKMLREDALQNREIVERFDREARAAAQLTSPHVARILDVDTRSDGVPFIVMERLRGFDLDQRMGDGNRVPVEEAVDYVLQACAAMAEAHARGIVHRDLKPNNLFCVTDGAEPVLKVLDFGISKVTQPGERRGMTQTTAAFGTPEYMSPDQIQSAKNVDGRADIWSLGVIVYELIAGTPPFFGENATATIWAICRDEPVLLSTFVEGVPQELAEVVAKALEKDRNQRWQTVHDFAEALAPFGSGTWQLPDVPVGMPGSEAQTQLLGAPDTHRSWSAGRLRVVKKSRATTYAIMATFALAMAAVVVAVFAARGPDSPAQSTTAPIEASDVEPAPAPLVPGEPSTAAPASAAPLADPSASAPTSTSTAKVSAPPQRRGPPSPKITPPAPKPPAPKPPPPQSNPQWL